MLLRAQVQAVNEMRYFVLTKNRSFMHALNRKIVQRQRTAILPVYREGAVNGKVQ